MEKYIVATSGGQNEVCLFINVMLAHHLNKVYARDDLCKKCICIL